MTALIDVQSNASENPLPDNRKYKMIAEDVSVYYDGIHTVKNITMKFKEKSVTSLIGPSGCGKTTFLRRLNRDRKSTRLNSSH